MGMAWALASTTGGSTAGQGPGPKSTDFLFFATTILALADGDRRTAAYNCQLLLGGYLENLLSYFLSLADGGVTKCAKKTHIKEARSHQLSWVWVLVEGTWGLRGKAATSHLRSSDAKNRFFLHTAIDISCPMQPI